MSERPARLGRRGRGPGGGARGIFADMRNFADGFRKHTLLPDVAEILLSENAGRQRQLACVLVRRGCCCLASDSEKEERTQKIRSLSSTHKLISIQICRIISGEYYVVTKHY